MSALSDRRGHFGKDYLSCLSISRRHARPRDETTGLFDGHERPFSSLHIELIITLSLRELKGQESAYFHDPHILALHCIRVRLRTSRAARLGAPFRIAQLDLAGSGGLVAKLIKRGFATCKNRSIFEAVMTTGLLLERVDEALCGHC